MEQSWNQSEFITFLLIYASHADIDFSDEEKNKIKTMVSDETFDKMYDHFKNVTDYQALEVILSYKGMYYPTVDRKNELLSKLKELFYIDGEYSVMEKGLYSFLEKLM